MTVLEGDVALSLLCVNQSFCMAELEETSLQSLDTRTAGTAEATGKKLIQVDGTTCAVQKKVACIV